MTTTQQKPLTVVAKLRERSPEELVSLGSELKALERDVIDALGTVSTLHFGRFVLLPDEDGKPARLAFESNHDGERSAHVAELAKALAPFETRLFGACEGYAKGDLAAFVERHALPASTFYLGHPGLSVRQIKNDDDVRRRLVSLLDELDREGAVEGKTAVDVRATLLERFGQGLTVGAVDRGLPVKALATAAMAGVIAAVAALAVGFLPAAIVTESREAGTDLEKNPRLVSEGDRRLDAIIAHEDSVTQNGLTHFVPMRPGAFRKTTMRLVLWFLEHARKKVAYEGRLGGISSIHFARWVLLEDDTVLFFSNYDGSWEAYLGDFVDKAHHYLSAVWSNTRWFPRTRALVFDGAAQEASFKQWTRTFQVENQIWYSAYPHLTVADVLANARIRENAVGSMNEEDAQAWLALL